MIYTVVHCRNKGRIEGCIFDSETGVVFNPNSDKIKLIANNIREYRGNTGDYSFRSNRRGFAGYYYVEKMDTIESPESDISLINEFTDTLNQCPICNKYHEDNSENLICKKCLEKGADNCGVCGRPHLYLYEVDGFKDKRCKACIPEKAYAVCSTCGIYYKIKDYYKYAHQCIKCFHGKDNHKINSYHKNPPLKFKEHEEHKSSLFFGFELEVDGGGILSYNSSKLGEIVDEDVFFSKDRSITNGFEIISHPMNYEYFMDRKDLYAKMFQEAINLGYKSHKTDTCGLHFHISREYVTEREVLKLIYLFEQHWDNIAIFSRRSKAKLNKWASRYGNYHIIDMIEKDACNDEKVAIRKIISLAWNGRHKAINLNNSKTIEFRVFRGTLNIETFVASMQFIHHLINMVKTVDFEELITMSWVDLMKNDSYKELNEYLKIVGLDKDMKVKVKRVSDI